MSERKEISELRIQDKVVSLGGGNFVVISADSMNQMKENAQRMGGAGAAGPEFRQGGGGFEFHTGGGADFSEFFDESVFASRILSLFNRSFLDFLNRKISEKNSFKFNRNNRLCNITAEPFRKIKLLGSGNGVCCKCHQGSILVDSLSLSDLFGSLKAVHIRHHVVDKDNVILVLLAHEQCFSTGRCPAWTALPSPERSEGGTTGARR